MADSVNEKLTTLLKGRSISGTSDSSGEKTISFTDGSKLSVKVAPSNSNSASTGGAVTKVRQSTDPPILFLELEGGATVEIPLASADSGITLKSKDDSVEYDG
jgi:hypothetical protein